MAGSGGFESGAQAYTSTGWPLDTYSLLIHAARAGPAPIKSVTVTERSQICLMALICTFTPNCDPEFQNDIWVANAQYERLLFEIDAHGGAGREISVMPYDFLKELAGVRSRGIELHLSTVQEHERAEYLWQTLGLRNRFDAMHYAADIGWAKPSGEVLRCAAGAVREHWRRCGVSRSYFRRPLRQRAATRDVSR